jgi:hypothetical protein
MILPRASGAPAAAEGSEFGTTPDTKPEARLNSVAIWWITWGVVWTFMVAGGMLFLYKKRNTPTLRLRSLSLTFAGIILLHLYWFTVQIGYSIGPLAPEVVEFWIMSIWYPFGIALFQAGNSQFLHVAKAQSRFAHPPSQMKTRYDEKRMTQKGSLLQRLRQMDYSKRMFLFVTLGMVVQVSGPVYFSRGRVINTMFLAHHCRRHLHDLPQVSPRLWHPRHRSDGRLAHGDCHETGPGLGVVSHSSLIH